MIAPRPLMIAIGPIAATRSRGHLCSSELAVIDLLVLDGASTPLALDPRMAIVCLFDQTDEASWPTVATVTRLARAATPLPVILVLGDERRRREPCFEALGRTACHLGVSVVAAPHDDDGLARTALLPLEGLVRRGPLGFDSADVHVVVGPHSIGVAAFGWPGIQRVLSTRPVSSVLASVTCHGATELAEINDACERLAGLAPDADILVSTPFRTALNDTQVGVIALHPAVTAR